MKLLTVTSLFPNHIEPNLGIFINTRLRYLRNKFPDVEHTVIAPVPWFPSSNERFGQYAKYAQVKSHEVREGVDVYHPKYLVIPKVGMLFTPFTMAFAIWRQLRRLKKQGKQFDLIDGHYFYPDGVAIALAMKLLKLPFTLTARGTDLNLIPQYKLPRKLINWAAKKAAHSITVCAALKDVLVEMGHATDSVTVMRNGVNLELFTQASNREALREKLGITGTTLVSVGYLIERKGHHLIIEALTELPNVNLVIVGNGPWEHKLKQLAIKLGVAARVKFAGSLPQQQVAEYFQAGDIGMLASSREGWANVLLESMACGSPVVATKVWGTPEVVAKPEAGVLVERNPQALAKGIQQLLAQGINRDSTRAYAELFNWDETSDAQYQLFNRILN